MLKRKRLYLSKLTWSPHSYIEKQRCVPKNLHTLIPLATLRSPHWQRKRHDKHEATAQHRQHKWAERLPCPSSSSSAPRPWSPQSSPSAVSSWRPAEASSRSCLPPPRLWGPQPANEASLSPFSSGPCRKVVTDVICCCCGDARGKVTPSTAKSHYSWRWYSHKSNMDG